MAIMFPPAERDQMMRTLIEQFSGQVKQAAPLDSATVGDAGLSTMLTQFQDNMIGLVMPTVQAHLPKIIEATAVAYTHEFDLAELKEILTLSRGLLPASTTCRARPLSSATRLVAEVNTAYLRDVQQIVLAKQSEFRDQLLAYFQAHPDVAAKVVKASRQQ